MGEDCFGEGRIQGTENKLILQDPSFVSWGLRTNWFVGVVRRIAGQGVDPST